MSHDVRTSLTRLKLAIEELADGELKRAMAKETDAMDAMISATLSFASADAKAEASRDIDIASLLISLCDEATDRGGHAEVSAIQCRAGQRDADQPISRGLGRGGPRTAGAAAERRDNRGGCRLESVYRYPERLCVDLDRDVDRERAGEKHDDGVEVVVVPVAAEPGGIRRIGIGRRGEPQDEAQQDQGDQAARAKHATSLPSSPEWSSAALRNEGLFTLPRPCTVDVCRHGERL